MVNEICLHFFGRNFSFSGRFEGAKLYEAPAEAPFEVRQGADPGFELASEDLGLGDVAEEPDVFGGGLGLGREGLESFVHRLGRDGLGVVALGEDAGGVTAPVEPADEEAGGGDGVLDEEVADFGGEGGKRR